MAMSKKKVVVSKDNTTPVVKFSSLSMFQTGKNTTKINLNYSRVENLNNQISMLESLGYVFISPEIKQIKGIITNISFKANIVVIGTQIYDKYIKFLTNIILIGKDDLSDINNKDMLVSKFLFCFNGGLDSTIKEGDKFTLDYSESLGIKSFKGIQGVF